MTYPIYLDHAATTPVTPEVLACMQPFFHSEYGNPSSVHALGVVAQQHIWEARNKIAGVLHCNPQEIVFTGSGTEGDNLAVFGVAQALAQKGKRHIVTTPIEHHAVLRAVERLAADGWTVTYLPVDEYGVVQVRDLEKAIRPDTALVSIIYANNEIGTVQDIAALGQVCARAGVVFHTDACQAAGDSQLDVTKLHVDLLTLNGGKIYGPKGVGVLYIRRGTPLQPQIVGGQQEFNLRAGTENVAGIVGLATALDLADSKRTAERLRLAELRDWTIAQLQRVFPKIKINGHTTERLANNINFSLPGLDGDAAVIYLSQRGVYCSTGSACDTENQGGSHVLRAIGVKDEYILGTLRWSMGRGTTQEDMRRAVGELEGVVKKVALVV